MTNPPWRLELSIGTYSGAEIEVMLRQLAETWFSHRRFTLRVIRLKLDQIEEISVEEQMEMWGSVWNRYTEPMPINPALRYVLEQVLIIHKNGDDQWLSWRYPQWMTEWQERWDEWQEAEWARKRALINPHAKRTIHELYLTGR